MAAGTMIGAYRLGELLGQGRTGAVHAAAHKLLGERAAVKLLLPALSQQHEPVRRFFHEARAAGALGAGAVAVHDFGFHDDGSAYLVMARLDGDSLAARLRRGPVPAATALAIARQVAVTLVAAHAHDLIHRELGPASVVVTDDDGAPGGVRATVLDFGLARLLAAVRTRPRVETARSRSRPLGMPAWNLAGSSPALAIDHHVDHHADHQVDLHALGGLLFAMLEGRTPALNDGARDGLAAPRTLPLPAPRGPLLTATVAPAIEALVQTLLAVDPERRLPDAEAAVAAIDRAAVLAGFGRGGAGALGERTPALVRDAAAGGDPDPARAVTAGGTPRRSRRRLTLAAATIVALVVAGALLASSARTAPRAAIHSVAPRAGALAPTP